MAYLTTEREGSAEENVRGSRFLGWAGHAPSAEDALRAVARFRRHYPDASHHCFAYRIGDEMRSSDDGEPGGTAGRPILEVVLKRELDRTAVIVVRYFGGTKLGAGGLVRAYSGTAAKALDAAGTRAVEDTVMLEALIPYPAVDAVKRLLEGTRAATVRSEEFGGEGWRLEVELPEAEADEFRRRLLDITSGGAELNSADPKRSDGR